MPSAPPTQAELGRAVKRLRLKHGLTIEHVAHRAAMHPTYLSGIERGNYNPSWTKLRGLAHALEVELSALVRAAEAERPR